MSQLLQLETNVVHGYSQLPIEILEAIIHSNDDGPSLASWSLVCRVWSVIARKHRFREVTILAGGATPPPSSSLLCDPRSTILPFVDTIRFEEGIDVNVWPQYDTLGYQRRKTSRENELPFLDNILPKIRFDDLTTLRSIEVLDFNWKELSEESRRAFIELCRPVSSLSLICQRTAVLTSSTLVQLLGAVSPLKLLPPAISVQTRFGL
ncbi:hypothetical protein C8Q72DRAFT_883421 [Fomitopsis betulina]|nr:hypothetical protein C8Q72DRAFT_883421 [Fomitopsis betulina]